MGRIKTVLFDLDGTLRLNSPTYAQIFDDYVSSLDGIPDNSENRRRAMRWEHHYWANSLDLQSDRERFGEDMDGFWINYNRRRMIVFGLHPHRAAALAKDAQNHMNAIQPLDVLEPDALPTLAELKAQGLHIGLVSNRLNPVDDLLQELGLAGYLEFSIISGQVQAWKPDPAIFLHALERCGSIPGETMYVGDNYFADVVGARRAGIFPVLFDPLHVFDDSGCPVITKLGQIIPLLNNQAR